MSKKHVAKPTSEQAETSPERRASPWPEWMGRDLPDFFDFRWPRAWPPRWPEVFEGGAGTTTMRIEESEEDGQLVIRGEIPDVDPAEDIDIRVADGRLTIRAERREKKESDQEGRHRSEFRYGSYERSIMLPAGVTEDDVEASYTDGILEVHVPIPEHPEGGRKVPVTR